MSSVVFFFFVIQFTVQPSHFTENSSYLIDLLLVSHKDHLLLTGVGDPFLIRS